MFAKYKNMLDTVQSRSIYTQMKQNSLKNARPLKSHTHTHQVSVSFCFSYKYLGVELLGHMSAIFLFFED